MYCFLQNIVVVASSLAAFISIIVTVTQFNKKNNLEYITQERAKWRKTLRKILVDIEDTSKRENAIIRLKGQLNPYGINIDKKNMKPDVMKDGHIWNLLDACEDEKNYERLSLYVELLLKYDWERSKNEVKCWSCSKIKNCKSKCKYVKKVKQFDTQKDEVKK